MTSGPIAALSKSGLKLHLQHGPIDLIISADGPPAARARAFHVSEVALASVLEDLVGELGQLRMASSSQPQVVGPVARRMVEATSHYGERFITPMAAVAGAVADYVLDKAMDDELERLTVNNGGDIAFGLGPNASTTIGLVVAPSGARLAGTVRVAWSDPVRGVASSGWRGRSFSLGVADAVTVLARDAATADAAATAIASAVDLLGHPGVTRARAVDLDASSDLGDRLVTTHVSTLSERDQRDALEPGSDLAWELLKSDVLYAALLVVGESWVSIHAPRRDPFAGTQTSERNAQLVSEPPAMTLTAN